METLTIKIKNDKARKLIHDLEALDILEIMETRIGSTEISTLKQKLSSPMNEKDIDEQLKKSR